MHNTIEKYNDIISSIKLKVEEQKNINFPKIIAVSKTFQLEKILPLINHGHLDYGENKVQEAINKWTEIKLKKSEINLHSVDSKKLAKKIAEEELKQNKKMKLFLQVNIGNEDQKSGVAKDDLEDLYNYCKDLKLDIVGLMCIPPANDEPEKYFKETNLLNKKLNLLELSMGMSSDYLQAVENSSTFLRIGSNIFGHRN